MLKHPGKDSARTMPVFELGKKLVFPDPSWAEPDGLLAVGGDLSVERLRLAYSMGIFPWYMEEPILWFSPDPRFVLFPEKIKVSKSLEKSLKNGKFELSFDRDFRGVIESCIKSHEHKGTWITREMLNAYTELHEKGIARSVEVMINGELVGGLYGVISGRVFCGESMFHTKRDASKIALVFLAGKIRDWGLEVIDSQVYTRHLESMGAEFISRSSYLKYLEPKCL